ncbi:MAG: hypothetical protein MO853_09145 [Candidatus Protistobacter heckmanni]|nr:hypothetical protein [Candidatus Protistobacter heckmanni]
MVDLVCVNWGTKYSPNYALRLYNMVRRNTARDFRFYVLTDDPAPYADGPLIPLLLQPVLGG